MNITAIEDKIINKEFYKQLDLLITDRNNYDLKFNYYFYEKINLLISYFQNYIYFGTNFKEFLKIMNRIKEDNSCYSLDMIVTLIIGLTFPSFKYKAEYNSNVFKGTLHIINYFLKILEKNIYSRKEKNHFKKYILSLFKRQYDLNLITIEQYQIYIKILYKNENIFSKFKNWFIIFNK